MCVFVVTIYRCFKLLFASSLYMSLPLQYTLYVNRPTKWQQPVLLGKPGISNVAVAWEVFYASSWVASAFCTTDNF